jgi:hypothetical protein
MKKLLQFIILIFIILINYQFCNAQAIAKNLNSGVNLLKEDGANLNISYNLTLPPNTSSITIEIENSDTVNAITYSVFFATQSWTFIQGAPNSFQCVQNFGAVPNPTVASSYVTQTLAASGQNFYSCPATPINKLNFKYTTTTPGTGSLSIWAIVNSNGIAYTTPPINGNSGLPNSVAGTTPVNGSLAAVNPVAVGGKNISGNNDFIGIGRPGDGGGSVYNSMAIGGHQNTSMGIGNVQGQFTLPAGDVGGPLAVMPVAQRVTVGSAGNLYMSEGTPQGGVNGNPPGLFILDTGYVKIATIPVAVSSNGAIVNLFSSISSGNGVYHACYVTIDVTNTGGTAPTLDVFFQTSNDGTNWTDRIHFIQVTTATSHQYSGISEGVGGINPTVTQDRALAVGTKVDGPIGLFGRITATIAGTSPTYNFAYGVSCT